MRADQCYAKPFFVHQTLWVTVPLPLQMGGPEMLIHHVAAFLAVALSSWTQQAHMYTLILLSTEMTTPFVNGRWILDQMVRLPHD